MCFEEAVSLVKLSESSMSCFSSSAIGADIRGSLNPQMSEFQPHEN